jgi:hypothetical protein
MLSFLPMREEETANKQRQSFPVYLLKYGGGGSSSGGGGCVGPSPKDSAVL